MRLKHRQSLPIVAIGLYLLAASAAAPAGGDDLTPAYEEAFRRDCGFGPAHAARLRRYKVLLVPGYFSDIDPAYYADQLRWLGSIGVEREKVAVHSRQGVAVNAPVVAAAIRNAGKPVILVTHSKGSVDALEALRAAPALQAKVKGWISLQGAFLGTPVADALLDGSMLDPVLAIAILQVFGGTKQSAEDMTTAASRARYREHATEIDTLLRAVPTLAFASALEPAPEARPNTILEFPFELMRRKGIRSDGLVPIDAAVLPGMDFVKVEGVDHIAPVMPARQAFERLRMTRALLLTLRGPFRGLALDEGCRRGGQPPGAGRLYNMRP